MITRLLGRLWKIPAPAFAIDRVQNLPVPMRDGVSIANVWGYCGSSLLNVIGG